MANYPNKPWSDGQTFEVVPGETFVYDATQAVWTHQTKATLDSDFQVDKAVLQSDISSNTSAIADVNARVDADSDRLTVVSAKVDALELMSDSETARIQSNIENINTAFAMLDSDGVNLQALRTDLDAEIAATNGDVTALTARLDSDETKIQDLQTQIDSIDTTPGMSEADHDSDIGALAIPVVSPTQPAGKTGQLWINTTDGKLYYWNDSDTFVSIVTV